MFLKYFNKIIIISKSNVRNKKNNQISFNELFFFFFDQQVHLYTFHSIKIQSLFLISR
jgi:hypothetical protein